MIDLNSFFHSINFSPKETTDRDPNAPKPIRVTLSWGHMLDLLIGRSLRFKAGDHMIEVRHV